MERIQKARGVSAPRRKKKVRASRIVVFVLLILYTFSLFFPLYTVIVTSFTSMMESSATTQFIWLPKHPTFDSYISVFTADINADHLGAPWLVVGLWNTLWLTLR